MKKVSERIQQILAWFEVNSPNPVTELQYSNPYELLVAVILSAQCTDKRVNMVTPSLFSRFPDPESLAAAGSDEIFPFIRSISYPNNKAKHLSGMGKLLWKKFKGVVPEKVEDLQSLPGVGRKTANVISSVVYDAPNLAVDTHVHRVSMRLGLTKNAKTPLETEKQLLKVIPLEKRARAHHWLILHGRYICMSRKPKCGICGLINLCPYKKKELKAG